MDAPIPQAERHGPWPGWITHVVLIAAVWIVFLSMYPSASPDGLTTPGYRAHAFKVMMVDTLAKPGEPRYGFTTMARLLEGPPPPGSTFLLPEDTVRLPGGDLHEARVIERHADHQVIEYRFVNTKSSTGRYKAYRDRVEPMWLELLEFFALALYLLPLTAGAMVAGALLNRVSRRRTAHHPQ